MPKGININLKSQKMASTPSPMKLRIGEVSIKQADNKLFRPLPKTLPSNPAQKNWFAFDSKGYHAFGIFESDGTLVLRPDIQVCMTLSQDDNDDFISDPASQQKGIYWFQCVKPTDAGNMKVQVDTIQHQDEVARLTCEIEVMDSASDKGSKNTGRKSIESSTSRKDETLQSEGTTPRSSRKRRAQDEPPTDDAVTPCSTPISESQVVLKGNTSSESCDKVALSALDIPSEPYPCNDAIEPIRRLERVSNPGMVALKDGTLHLSVPQALAIVLFDDRAHVQSIANCASRSDQLRFGNSTYYTNTPTVNDLIIYFGTKCKISETSDVLDFVEGTFEYFFEDALLYTEERYWLRPKIADIQKSNGKSFLTSFGPIMLLRHIMFLSATVDKSYVGSADALGDSSQAIAVGDRKSSSMQKLLKASAEKMHDVLQFILKELDEMAHYLF
jgi:hypothetical protein